VTDNASPGLGQPGQRVVKYEGEGSDLWQVLRTVKWGVVLSVSLLLLFILDTVILGPMGGFYVGLLAILFAFAVLQKTAIVRKQPYRQQIVNFVVFIGALVMWATWGIEWLEENWIPYVVYWPVWIEAPIEVVSWLLKIWLLTGCWRLWWEIVDPNGPTAPRAAVVRDKSIAPWDRETFGQVQVRQEPPADRVPLVDVRVSYPNGRQKIAPEAIPYTVAWWEYVGLVLRRKASFSEADAKKYCSIGTNEFRQVRDAFMDAERDWAFWIDERHHQQGIGFTDAGWAALEGFRALPCPRERASA